MAGPSSGGTAVRQQEVLLEAQILIQRWLDSNLMVSQKDPLCILRQLALCVPVSVSLSLLMCLSSLSLAAPLPPSLTLLPPHME